MVRCMKFKVYLKEAERGKVNVATTPLAQAKKYAQEAFSKAGRSFELPDFDKNYTALQKSAKSAVNIPREMMPVIEPKDMDKFNRDIQSGRVDIFKPYAKGHLATPTGMSKEEKDEWIELGFKDGSLPDDKIKAQIREIEARKLKPTQSQIWFDKIISLIIKFGVPGAASPIAKKTIIVSKEGMILDGHHRYGQAMMGNPALKMKVLSVPVDIKTLVKVGRTYGEYLGNKQRM